MPRIYTRRPVIDRVIDKLTDVSGHWIWGGTVGSSGYGQVSSGPPDYKWLGVHRATWEYFRGPIPPGLVLDHLDNCLNILCCNPFTCLEPVTQAVNLEREWRRRTACRAGHLWTPENTRITPGGNRDCRQCHRDRNRAGRERRKL